MDKIKITINGEQKEIAKNTTVEKLLSDLNVLDKTMAVAVNLQIVKKEDWSTRLLNDNDKIEALTFVGGG